jgi:1-acyl-sn-glycerol-3-phosphate acyltransferase
MSEHLAVKPFAELIELNQKIVFSEKDISTKSKVAGKLRYWWSWIFPTVMFLLVAPPVMLVASIVGRKHWLYPLCHWGAVNWIKWCGVKMKVSGQENLRDDQHYVFVANHRSYLDTATMFAYTGRRMGFVAKKELAQVPVVGTLMPYVNILKIDRSNSAKALQTMNDIREVFEKGISIGIFAEGTRAYPNELLPFKKGAFHLAIQAQAPIVPVAIKNTDWLMGKKTGLAYPGTIEVVLLPPIETKGLTVEKDLDELLRKVRGVIAEALSN